MPAIIAMWHGQHFMAPFIKRKDPRHRTKVLISRHRDGEINARAAGATEHRHHPRVGRP